MDTLSVLENVAVADGFDGAGARPIPWKQLRKQVRELLSELGIEVQGEELVGGLTRAEQALVAIARAIRQLRIRENGSRALIVLDEPTASLTRTEAERVFQVLKSVAAGGGAVVFVSHKLDEVVQLCHRVSVLRDGTTVATTSSAEVEQERLIELMLGAAPEHVPAERLQHSVAQSGLSVRGLSGSSVSDVSFDVPSGRIVGVAGLVGMGQDEVPYLIGGASPARAGTVSVKGAVLAPLTIHTTQRAGLFVVPADRRGQGLWVEATASENLELPLERKNWWRGWRDSGAALRRAAEQMQALQVSPLDPGRQMWAFSGGNQQKVLLAKWLQMQPVVLVLHEPTQGVDVGAKRDIHEIIRRLADAGAAICVCSSDLEELAALCDEVITLHSGRASTVLRQPEVSLASIVAAVNRSAKAIEEAS